MKDSIYKTYKFIKKTGLDVHQIMTVHDELAFEIRKEHAYKWLLRGIKHIMEDNEERICIPMIVECKRAIERWDVKKDVPL
jgi:DNA polymerase I-like protein with 3'-5' exonuclease and polymerase domains